MVVVVVVVVVIVVVVTRPEIFGPGKTHLHLMLLPFLRLFPELAPDHGFGKNDG